MQTRGGEQDGEGSGQEARVEECPLVHVANRIMEQLGIGKVKLRVFRSKKQRGMPQTT